MKTLEERIKDLNIKMSCTWGNREEDKHPNMDSWTCKLTRREEGKRYSLTTPFFMGYGHKGKEPSIKVVLDCMLADSASIENSPDFEDWAREYGQGEDSREAKKTFPCL